MHDAQEISSIVQVHSDSLPQDNDTVMQSACEPEYRKSQIIIALPEEDKLGIISDETEAQPSATADNLGASLIQPCGSDAVPIPETSNIPPQIIHPVSNVSETNFQAPADNATDTSSTTGPSSSLRASRKRSASAEPSLDESRRKKIKIVSPAADNSGSTSQKPVTKLNTSTSRRGGSRTLQRSGLRNGAPATRSTNITKASLRSSRSTTKSSDKVGSNQEPTARLADSHSSHVKQGKLIEKPRQLAASNPPSDRPKFASVGAAAQSGGQQRGSVGIERGGLTRSHGTLNSLSSSDSSLVQGKKHTLHESSRMVSPTFILTRC